MILPVLGALAPIVLVIVLLVLRVPASWAALAALLVAGAGTLAWFPLSIESAGPVLATMGPTTLTVIFILLGGVALAEASARSGGQEIISRWLRGTVREDDALTTLVLIAFGVTPFAESVTGFGLGVLVSAPLLLRLGLSPVKAIITAMLGLVLVPWGSLAPGTLIASELGEVHFIGLGVFSALLSLPVLLICLGLIVGMNHGRPSRRDLGFLGVLLLVEWAVLILANLVFGPPVAGVLASLAVIACALGRLHRAGALPAAPPGLGGALGPYAFLLLGLLAASGVEALTGWHEAQLANPGLWLMLTAALTVLAQRWRASVLRSLGRSIRQRWLAVSVVTVLYLGLGTLMSANGMAAQLAASATALGGPFILLVPLIGALGGYLTGSNSGAAAMFSSATASAAVQLGYTPLPTLAAQNIAGSIAIIASPARIALAGALVLEPGQRLPVAVTRTLLLAVGVIVVVLGLAMPWVGRLPAGFWS